MILISIESLFVQTIFSGYKKKNSFINTEQNVKFSIKDFFSKYNQIHRKQWIWSHLLKKSGKTEKLHFLYCVNLERYNG